MQVKHVEFYSCHAVEGSFDLIYRHEMKSYVQQQAPPGKARVIADRQAGEKITGLTYNDKKIEGYFIPYHELVKGKKLVISTQ